MNTAISAESGPIIALDTSTAAMAAAVLRGGELLGEVQSLAERNHSVHVITHVKELMESSQIAPEELAGIVVGNGPGSYTGMRIAVTAAKTLAWCWDKPLVGVSSLEAMAFGAWHQGAELALAELGDEFDGVGPVREHWVLPIMDARRGQVYSAGFKCRAEGTALEGWERFAEDGVRLMEQWVDVIGERLAAAAAKNETVVCENVEYGTAGRETSVHETAERKASGSLRHVDSRDGDEAMPVVWLVGDLSLHGPSAERLAALGAEHGADIRLMPYVMEGRYLAELGMKRLAAGESDDAHTFIPNYTQLTEAEVKLKAKQAGES